MVKGQIHAHLCELCTQMLESVGDMVGRKLRRARHPERTLRPAWRRRQ